MQVCVFSLRAFRKIASSRAYPRPSQFDSARPSTVLSVAVSLLFLSFFLILRNNLLSAENTEAEPKWYLIE